MARITPPSPARPVGCVFADALSPDVPARATAFSQHTGMTLHPYYINIMLRDPVFCNSVRGFVAEISHFGPLQARPAARRSKRPVPRTVPAARLSHPACLRLPPAAPRPPSVPPSASPSRARFRLSACRPPHASGCRLPSPTHLRLPSADPRPPPAPPSASPPPAHGSGCPPAVSHVPPAVRLPSPTHLRLPSAAHACRPRPPSASPPASPVAHPAPAVSPSRRPCLPSTCPPPPPPGQPCVSVAGRGGPALFFWKIRNVPKIALQPYAAVI